jgi:hypothetical protein
MLTAFDGILHMSEFTQASTQLRDTNCFDVKAGRSNNQESECREP